MLSIRPLIASIIITCCAASPALADIVYPEGVRYKEGECNIEKAERDARDLFGWTTLTLSVLRDDQEQVKTLLTQGEDVNTTDTFHRSLLLLACENDSEEMARLLINDGADVKTADKRGRTPLSATIESENLPLAKLLLKKGAEINIFGKAHQLAYNSPLQWAISQEQIETVRFLLENGADPNAVYVNPRNSLNVAPLCMAAQQGNIDCARLLLKHGATTMAKPLKKDEEQYQPRSPLEYAAQNGQLNMLRFLLKNGASAQPEKGRNSQLLSYAVKCKSTQPEIRVAIVQALLDAGADVFSHDFYGTSLLASAVWIGDAKMVKLLLGKGYNPNLKSERELPVIQTATYNGDLDIVRMLIAAGADPHVQFGKKNALDRAYNVKHPEIIEFYEKECGMKRSPSSTAPMETRTTSRKSEKYNSVGEEKISIDKYEIIVESTGHISTENGEFIKDHSDYYISFKGSPNRVLLGKVDEETTRGSDRIYYGIGHPYLNWLKKDELMTVTWENESSARSQATISFTKLLSIQGNKIQTAFIMGNSNSSRTGGGSYNGGGQYIRYDDEKEEIIISESLSSYRWKRDTFLPRISKNEDSNRAIYEQNCRLKRHRYRLESNSLKPISSKSYISYCNELPLVNIAASCNVSLHQLREWNPGLGRDVFCKGTLCLGPIPPLESAPEY